MTLWRFETRPKLALAVPALALLLNIFTQAQSISPNVIAVVDLQHAIEGTADFRTAAEQWTAAMHAETAGVSAKQEELRLAREMLAAEEALNDSASSALVQSVDALQREFDRMNADVQSQLNDLREQLILPIAAKVDQAIQQFAEENSLVLILDLSNPMVSILLNDDTIDITAALVDSMVQGQKSEDLP